MVHVFVVQVNRMTIVTAVLEKERLCSSIGRYQRVGGICFPPILSVRWGQHGLIFRRTTFFNISFISLEIVYALFIHLHLILFDKYRLSFPASIPPRVWAVG